MSTRVLLTGAAGFIGSHVLEHILVNTDWEVVCPITMRHMGSWSRLARALDREPDSHKRVLTMVHDLTTPFSNDQIASIGGIDVIMNVASQSHVDRSLSDPVPFVRNNFDMMTNMLELACKLEPRMFLQMSTDEVYGPAAPGHAHVEWETPYPSNPYSASKAAQESLAYAWWRSFEVPVVITNTMNIFGETQDPEKFFAKVMRACARDEVISIHAQQRNDCWDGWTGELIWEPGSRMWLHARNLADAWVWLTTRALDGWVTDVPEDARREFPNRYGNGAQLDRFNIVGEREIDNLEMANIIADAMNRTARYEMVDFHSSRPGHDLRYALDGAKLANLGWKHPISVEEGIARTVRWTLAHPQWL